MAQAQNRWLAQHHETGGQMTDVTQSIISRGDLAHLALFLWATGASALLGYVLKELSAANRRFDELVLQLALFNRRFGDDK